MERNILNNKCIIRTAVGSMASGGMVKFLKSNNFTIVGTDIMDKSVGQFLVDDYIVVPKATQANEKYVVNIYNSIIEKTGADWIISGPENEVEILIKNRKNIKANVFHLPYETFLKVSDKYELHKNMIEIGVKTPFLYTLNDLDVLSLNEKVNYVLKPKKGRGSTGVHIVKGINLKEISKKIEVENYLIQEYIEGKEVSVDTLHDFKGNLLNAVVRERNHVESGISVISTTFYDEKIIEIIKKISENLSFYGFNCIQFIQDKMTGEYYVTDINPRFGGGAILSLQASLSMQDNFLRLLINDNVDEMTFDNRYNIVKMYRGYEEYFE